MEVPEHLHQHAAQLIDLQTIAAHRSSWWATILRLCPFQDGDKWCVLWGENIQDGIAAFGDTPEAAMFAFDNAMLGIRRRDV
jgi:hypothetical protein